MFAQLTSLLFSYSVPHPAFIAGIVLGAIDLFFGIAIIPWIIGVIVRASFRKKARENVVFWWKKHVGPVRFLMLGILFLFVRPFPAVSAGITSHIIQGLTIWFIAGIAWLALAATRAMKDIALRRYDISSADNLRARHVLTQVRMVQRVLTVAILFFAAAAALMTFSEVRQLGVSLLASAGIVGIVLGFAAQTSLANLFAGLQVAFAQPIRLDDVVVVEGEWGKIEEITLTYVVVKIWDERRLVLPVSYFIDKPFQNWTRTTSSILGTVFVYTDYTVPVDPIRKELERIVKGSPLWDKRVQLVQVTNATDRTVELRALVSAASSSESWDLRCAVREGLITFLQAHYPASLPRTRVELPSAQMPRKAARKKGATKGVKGPGK